LGIPLYTQETLLKYIGGYIAHLKHTILMFNLTNFDEVCVQATHIESGGRNVHDSFSEDSVQSKEGKNKGKEKLKWTTMVKKEDEKPSCSYCKKEGHDDDKCWKLHPELKPKWFQNQKGNKKTTTIIQQDLGSYSDDEAMIVAMGIQGISFVARSSTSSHVLASNIKHDERKQNKLFHIRIISKHTKIDTLIDSGSQENLISEEVVKILGLETKPHLQPYPLGWICDNAKLQVTKQCKLRFAITSKFIDEVELDVIPLDICGIVLGSPYLYDRKAIFYREENKYCFTKDGIEYIVRAHHMKTDMSLVNTGQMKRLVNASKNLSLMSVKAEEECDPKHSDEIVKFVTNYDKAFQDSQELQHEILAACKHQGYKLTTHG
jgi:hypothetical protein